MEIEEKIRKEKLNKINEIKDRDRSFDKKNKILNFHKKRFSKFSQSSDSFSRYNEQEEEEDSFYKKNRTYKSKKVISNLNDIIKKEEPIRRIYIKKKKEFGDFEDVNTNKNVYEKKILSKKSISHQSSIASDRPLYTSKRLLPTKVKVYKCVIYKNFDPNFNEEMIKTMLHRNGSQILENGGFVVKLPKGSNNYNSQKNLI